MKKQQTLYVYNGVIGTKQALLVFANEDAILRRANDEDILKWKKVNK